jgi:hypothetical protein
MPDPALALLVVVAAPIALTIAAVIVTLWRT